MYLGSISLSAGCCGTIGYLSLFYRFLMGSLRMTCSTSLITQSIFWDTVRIYISSNVNNYSPSTTSGPQWGIGWEGPRSTIGRCESTEQKRRVWYLRSEWLSPQKSPCCWCSPGHSLTLSSFLMYKMEIQGSFLQGVKCISSPCPAVVTDRHFRQLVLRLCCYLLLLCLWKHMGGDRNNGQSPFVLVSLCP